MTRYQHRPWIAPNSIFSHVIIDTVTGRDIAWCCSLRDADTAVRLRNEDEDDSGITLDELIAKHGSQLVSDVLGEQVERELLRTLELGDAARAARAASLRPQPASRFSQSGIAIARKSA